MKKNKFPIKYKNIQMNDKTFDLNVFAGYKNATLQFNLNENGSLSMIDLAKMGLIHRNIPLITPKEFHILKGIIPNIPLNIQANDFKHSFLMQQVQCFINCDFDKSRNGCIWFNNMLTNALVLSNVESNLVYCVWLDSLGLNAYPTYHINNRHYSNRQITIKGIRNDGVYFYCEDESTLFLPFYEIDKNILWDLFISKSYCENGQSILENIIKKNKNDDK